MSFLQKLLKDVSQQDEGINQERGRLKIEVIGAVTQETGTGKAQNGSWAAGERANIPEGRGRRTLEGGAPKKPIT